MNTLLDVPVFDVVPNFEPGVGFKFAGRQASTTSAGKRVTAFPQLRPQASLTLSYLTRTAAEANTIQSFFEFVCGDGCSFWMPSWKNQLAVIGNPQAGGNTIQIRAVDYNDVFLSGPNSLYASGRYIFFYDFINPPEFQGIAAISSAGGIETLGLLDVLARTYVQKRFIAGLVYMMRFQDPRLEETWDSEDVMEAKVGFVETINWRPDPEPDTTAAGFGIPRVISKNVSIDGGDIVTIQCFATGSPTSYTISGLPSGLSFNTGTGIITGQATMPNPSTTTTTYTVTATNAYGTGSGTITITVRKVINIAFSRNLPLYPDDGSMDSFQISLDGAPFFSPPLDDATFFKAYQFMHLRLVLKQANHAAAPTGYLLGRMFNPGGVTANTSGEIKGNVTGTNASHFILSAGMTFTGTFVAWSVASGNPFDWTASLTNQTIQNEYNGTTSNRLQFQYGRNGGAGTVNIDNASIDLTLTT